MCCLLLTLAVRTVPSSAVQPNSTKVQLVKYRKKAPPAGWYTVFCRDTFKQQPQQAREGQRLLVGVSLHYAVVAAGCFGTASWNSLLHFYVMGLKCFDAVKVLERTVLQMPIADAMHEDMLLFQV